MLMKAQQLEKGHVETLLEVAVKRQLERIRMAETERQAKKLGVFRLWRRFKGLQLNQGT